MNVITKGKLEDLPLPKIRSDVFLVGLMKMLTSCLPDEECYQADEANGGLEAQACVNNAEIACDIWEHALSSYFLELYDHKQPLDVINIRCLLRWLTHSYLTDGLLWYAKEMFVGRPFDDVVDSDAWNTWLVDVDYHPEAWLLVASAVPYPPDLDAIKEIRNSVIWRTANGKRSRGKLSKILQEKATVTYFKDMIRFVEQLGDWERVDAQR